MQIGISLGINVRLRGGGFSPSILFANGEQGVWVAPDPDTCFTDTAGTTPAGVGDAVAYVEDLSGNSNHATQPTAAARPILARVPDGGRRNLMTRTEGFDNSVWARISTTTVEGGTGPVFNSEGSRLGRVISNEPENSRRVQQTSISITPSQTHRISIFVARDTSDSIRVSVFDGAVSTERGRILLSFSAGNWSAVASNGASDAMLTEVFPNVFRVSASIAANADTTAAILLYPDFAGVDAASFLGGAQLEEGSTASPYQRVGSTYDVTEAGKDDKWHLVFDGVDDFMGMPNNIITNQNAFSLAMSGDYRPNSGYGWVEIAGSIGGADSLIPTAELSIRTGGGYELWGDPGPGDFVYVMTHPGNGNISDTDAYLNGAESTRTDLNENTLDLGATTTTQLFSGVSGATNGNMYAAVILNRALTSDERSGLETYLAEKTGVSL